MTGQIVSKRRPLQDFVLAGRWRFDSVVGSGGDGTVYLANDERTRRQVAIKVYDSLVGYERDHIAETIDREAAVTSQVAGPYLVQVIAHGIARARGGRQTAYMVMEYLEGESLRSFMQRYPDGVPFALGYPIFRRILQAVSAIHKAGYVHLDLKPENIRLITPSLKGLEPAVKIYDFGNTRPVEQADSIGDKATPLYASPELCQRLPGLGYHSDVYSLGILFYEFFVGYPPLPEGEPIEIVAYHVFEELDPIPEGKLPPSADELFRAVTDKEPDTRIRSAQEFLERFEALGGH